jgi:hypothetical protein
MRHLLVLVIGPEASWRSGLVDPSTVITVIAFGDHNPDRPLAAGSVVPRHLLCTTDILVVQFESLAWLHVFERIFFVDVGLIEHHLTYARYIPQKDV